MRLRHIPGCEEFIQSSRECFLPEAAKQYRGRWQEAYPQAAPLHIEIGMGKGQFIRNLARLHPDIHYMGIEKYQTVLMKAIQRKRKTEQQEGEMNNLFFLCADAKELGEIFSPGEVDRIYLNFSDPWPKERHERRRLTAPGFLDIYKEILSSSGELVFKTDNRSLFEYSLGSIPRSGWKIIYQSFDFHKEPEAADNVMTEYEEKFSSRGNPICHLVAVRLPCSLEKEGTSHVG